jgi:leader peptidase (prepilin peptidase)/N-methyltransferase
MLYLVQAIYVLIIGLIFGSFFNVCIYRIPAGKSVAYPPSSCGRCNTRLRALDMIPVLSYIFLGGKCRYCKESFSPRYAVVEFMTGIIYMSIFMIYGFSFAFLKYVILSSFLIVIGMIDYNTTDVYSKTTYPAIAVGIIFIIAAYFSGYEVKSFILGGILGGGAITLIILLTKGMGWGDVEICLLCGLYLGFANTVLMLFLSFILGGVIGLLLIATKVKSRKDYMPFGPSIAIAAIIVIIFGEKIITWYLNSLKF